MADLSNPYAPPSADLEQRYEGAGMLGGELDFNRVFEETKRIVANNIPAVLGAGLAYMLPIFIVSFAGQFLLIGVQIAVEEGADPMLVFPAILAQNILVQGVQALLTLGIMKWAMELVTDKSPSPLLVFAGYRWILPGFAAYLLWVLGYLVGLLLLVVPGIIWILATSLHQFEIVERGVGPVDALKNSWEMTQGYKVLVLAWFMGVGFAIFLLMLFTCGFGALLSPAIWIGLAIIYRHARHRHYGV